MKKRTKYQKHSGKKKQDSGKKQTKGVQTKDAKKEPKKKSGLKRARTKYPGLTKGVNGKFRQEAIDFDYLDKLSSEEKSWLSAFMEEFNGANFKHQGKTLHKTKKQRRELYNKNNARQRDLFNHKRNTGLLVDEDQIREKNDTVNQEDILIDAIDSNDEQSAE